MPSLVWVAKVHSTLFYIYFSLRLAPLFRNGRYFLILFLRAHITFATGKEIFLVRTGDEFSALNRFGCFIAADIMKRTRIHKHKHIILLYICLYKINANNQQQKLA